MSQQKIVVQISILTEASVCWLDAGRQPSQLCMSTWIKLIITNTSLITLPSSVPLWSWMMCTKHVSRRLAALVRGRGNSSDDAGQITPSNNFVHAAPRAEAESNELSLPWTKPHVVYIFLICPYERGPWTRNWERTFFSDSSGPHSGLPHIPKKLI